MAYNTIYPPLKKIALGTCVAFSGFETMLRDPWLKTAADY